MNQLDGKGWIEAQGTGEDALPVVERMEARERSVEEKKQPQTKRYELHDKWRTKAGHLLPFSARLFTPFQLADSLLLLERRPSPRMLQGGKSEQSKRASPS